MPGGMQFNKNLERMFYVRIEVEINESRYLKHRYLFFAYVTYYTKNS